MKDDHEGKELKDPRDFEILRAQWVKAKLKLSRIPKACINAFLPGVEVTFRRDVERSEFEKQCEGLFNCITEKLLATLQRAKVRVSEIILA